MFHTKVVEKILYSKTFFPPKIVSFMWQCGKISYCMLSFGRFPGVWILYADVSEHSVPSS